MRYRKGIGAGGNVGAGTLTTLLSRPLGVGEASNPEAASGGEDPETIEHARDSAPLTVLTLDRAVSITDYAHFARAFAGIDKAHALWIPAGPARGVFVTIAGIGGARVEATSDTYRHLFDALRTWGDPLVPLRLENFIDARFRAACKRALGGFEPAAVVAAVRVALLARFAFAARAFGQTVSLDEIAAAAQGVRGVEAAHVARLHRSGQPAAQLPARLFRRAAPALDGGAGPGRTADAGDERPRGGGAAMGFDARSLFELLPAIHRIRDAELAQQMGDSLLTVAERTERDALAALAAPSEDEQQRLAALNEKAARGPLESLIAVFAEQIGAMDESLAQLYDDLFIETCADWVVPYIGDLIGYESLHSVAPKVASPRAEVAHTIALRRRKGTALVLEQLARDVTGWDARAVEYFQRLAATQYMNHPRPHALQSPDLRRGRALAWLGTPFETSMRTVEVRRIEHGGGRYNIPNVGLHLWRIQAFPHSASPAAHAGVRCYRASPLNHDLPLYNRPLAEDDISHLAGPDNVPWPLSRRRLAAELGRHYGSRPGAGEAVDNRAPALQLWVDGTAIERDRIRICNLSDDGAGWAHTPPPDGVYSIDPQLGRIALPGDAPDPADVRLDWREGFSAELGGGEYERGDSLPIPPGGAPVARVPAEHATLAAALAAIDGNGVVEIADNRRYGETLAIDVVADGSVEIRAANGFRPVLVVDGLSIRGGDNAACTLNGLLVTGAPLVVPDAGGNALARLTLLHCTLVPGIALAPDATPCNPTPPACARNSPGSRPPSSAASSAASVPIRAHALQPATA
ncbi:baseplate J/gp47 family protein [Thauera humireducens]|uniref:baseplate J/gp47 family protein n=1 Tax=Thauera humireducens TaxID=1134435 RepID=UPI00311EA858